MRDAIAREIIALEEGALARWIQGDPAGYLGLYAPDVSYLAEGLPGRVDGVEALRSLFSGMDGTPLVPSATLVDPEVRVLGGIAWLACNVDNFSETGERIRRWNCTEIYRRKEGEWRIVHSHWSIVQQGASA
ncbi:nuclear transport factor 2 family protein [Candidatus Bipolaricaulota bacterium]|nr:nuclear transport factor 2 family protein [Candidatus Bipolaricaulota bacterium]